MGLVFLKETVVSETDIYVRERRLRLRETSPCVWERVICVAHCPVSEWEVSVYETRRSPGPMCPLGLFCVGGGHLCVRDQDPGLCGFTWASPCGTQVVSLWRRFLRCCKC